jgi:hypothetical protein
MTAGFYELATIDGLAPSEGATTGARYGRMGVVVKTNAVRVYTVANEFIAAQLALAVGLPAPPGTIVKTPDGELAYAGFRFGGTDETFGLADVEALAAAAPMVAAGIAVFDCWINNNDRTAENLAFVTPANVAIFDHDDSVFGPSTRVGLHYAHRINKGVWNKSPCQYLRDSDHLEAWVERIQHVDDALISHVAEAAAAARVCTAAEAAAVTLMLQARKRRLHWWLHASRHEFPLIEEWLYQGATPDDE